MKSAAKRCRGVCVLMSLWALGVQWTSGAEKGEEPDFARLESRLEKLRERWKVPGMAAGVVVGERVVWQKEFGLADIESKRPWIARRCFILHR